MYVNQKCNFVIKRRMTLLWSFFVMQSLSKKVSVRGKNPIFKNKFEKKKTNIWKLEGKEVDVTLQQQNNAKL